jgi:hypothetical protein
MNKNILAHLNHLGKKADSILKPVATTYKPLSPFRTNKVQKINEQKEKVFGFDLTKLAKK